MSKQRLFYIDNLRIFLISLVVLHHFAITYGAPGGWYYNETEAGIPEIIPLAMFVATNQAFFMGLFFLVSAFFIVPSLNRKGIVQFINQRLLRLGIPLLLYYFILNPLTNFIVYRFIQKQPSDFLWFIFTKRAFGFGPMWFVEALILFTAVFLLVRLVKWNIKIPFPGTKKILLAAFFTGLGQFVIRIWLHVGWGSPFTNFQFPFFLQYILLFAAGIVAWQNNWFEKINIKSGIRWFAFSQILVFIGFPLLFYLGNAAQLGIDKFMGGFCWQSFSYAVWEQFVGFSMILGLLGIFKHKMNAQGSLAKNLSASAYGVFVFHSPVLVGLSALFINWQPPLLLKFAALAPLALFSCFLVAWLVKQIPVVKKIL